MNAHTKHLIRDLIFIALSVIIAITLVTSGILGQLLELTKNIKFVDSFIAGLFFTSAFTTAPAIVVLGSIAQHHSILVTAFFGALGAVIGDFIIFRFFEDALAEDFWFLVGSERHKRLNHIFKRHMFRWLTPLVGALIIASPLPDELGLALMGISKTKKSLFIPFSFCANFVGILIIGLIARAAMRI